MSADLGTLFYQSDAPSDVGFERWTILILPVGIQLE
jgi:hypothetical protein